MLAELRPEFVGQESAVELRHREVDLVEGDAGDVHNLRVALVPVFEVDLLDRPDAVLDGVVQPDGGKALAIQLAIPVLVEV